MLKKILIMVASRKAIYFVGHDAGASPRATRLMIYIFPFVSTGIYLLSFWQYQHLSYNRHRKDHFAGLESYPIPSGSQLPHDRVHVARFIHADWLKPRYASAEH
ncbi:uncharacterized protein BP01DRAFT_121527 [Aspergillus saccharolyticus JOP 1030-1]|uniref:Uncharacterized protein n=1 Tax=Aspergillus saccharolyticus JOP 1030-1 TaxID=1450539 RepID=A0A318ZNJ5_9EURO|nr:hypothetical protein BP01DRAFT_121527 [Aspergillus saccharolyticus JOP 1030-1]PYH49116.1 hypothetical protein BP01DRAFT_121527 [Aspergillus saccharolyticus JOP 1030-1]